MVLNDMGRWLQAGRGSTAVTTLEGPVATYQPDVLQKVWYIIRILNVGRYERRDS